MPDEWIDYLAERQLETWKRGHEDRGPRSSRARGWRYEKALESRFAEQEVKARMAKIYGHYYDKDMREINRAHNQKRPRFHYVEDPAAYSGLHQPQDRPARNDSYSGDPAPTRRRSSGKGRSFALRDTPSPSLDDRHGAPSRERISGLYGDSTGRQKGPAVFSNFGANKDFGDGIMGKSAGRLRGMVNMMSHPETFAGRFLWVYAAQQVSRTVQEWRAWDKVDWKMSHGHAQEVLKSENTFGKMEDRAVRVIGRLAGTIVGGMGEIGAGLLTPFAMTIPGGEAHLARGRSLVGSFAEWLGRGAEGMNPIWANKEFVGRQQELINSFKSGVRKSVESSLVAGMYKNASISANDIRMIAAGGPDRLVKAAMHRPEFIDRVNEDTYQALLKDGSYKDIEKHWLNRFMSDKEE